MRVLLIFLITSFAVACTSPIQENFRQLDINLDRAIGHKKSQVENLKTEIDGTAEQEVAAAFKSVSGSLESVNASLFENRDPDIFLLEEKNLMDEEMSLPPAEIETFRTELIEYSDRLNEISGKDVCTIQSDSIYMKSEFETFFKDQKAPALLVFVKKIELDCWQCRFMAAFEEISDTQDKKTN